MSTSTTLVVEAHNVPGLFQKVGDFPTLIDPEYPVAHSARDFYKNGRNSHFDVLPVFNYAPKLYLWFIRDRVRRLYRRLRIVDKALLTELTNSQLQALQNDLDNIDRAASIIPMRNSELFFDLEYHIERTRTHIASR